MLYLSLTLKIPENLINLYSWPNDVVLGIALWAAALLDLAANKNLNRKFIGIERKDAGYFEIAQPKAFVSH